MSHSSRGAWIGAAVWTLATWAAVVVTAHVQPWAESYGFWERVGTVGNSGLTALALLAAFFLGDRVLHGDAWALCGAAGMLLLALAHAVLPVSVLTGWIAPELILPIGRMLRAAAVGLLLPYAGMELWRVRPRRAGGR